MQDLLEQMMTARDNKTKNEVIKQVIGKISDEAMMTTYIMYGTAGAYTNKPRGVNWINGALAGAQEGIWGPEEMWVTK